VEYGVQALVPPMEIPLQAVELMSLKPELNAQHLHRPSAAEPLFLTQVLFVKKSV